MEELIDTHEKIEKRSSQLEEQISSLKKRLQNIPNNN